MDSGSARTHPGNDKRQEELAHVGRREEDDGTEAPQGARKQGSHDRLAHPERKMCRFLIRPSVPAATDHPQGGHCIHTAEPAQKPARRREGAENNRDEGCIYDHDGERQWQLRIDRPNTLGINRIG